VTTRTLVLSAVVAVAPRGAYTPIYLGLLEAQRSLDEFQQRRADDEIGRIWT
jgi:hypothetical protein